MIRGVDRVCDGARRGASRARVISVSATGDNGVILPHDLFLNKSNLQNELEFRPRRAGCGGALGGPEAGGYWVA